MKKRRVLSKEEYFNKGEHLRLEKRTATSFPLHSHEYFEIEVVVKGSGKNILNSKEYPFQRGSIYALTPSDFHEVVIEEEVELWNMVFDETIISNQHLNSFFAMKNLIKVVDEITLSKIEKVLLLIKEELTSGGHISALIEYFFKLILPRHQIENNNNPIYQAICYIENHFRSSPTLEETAKQACLSPVYFTTLLKKQTGETYISFLNNLKINYAKNLLDNGISITQTCFDSGFGSLSGFLYTFKQKVGLTPQEYAKKNKE